MALCLRESSSLEFKISNGKAETELKLTLQFVFDFVRYGHQLLS